MNYTANAIQVDAFVITKVFPTFVGDKKVIALVLEDGHEVHADEGMTARYMPVAGDYYVRQEDGYVYVNPKLVFEKKYSPTPEKVQDELTDSGHLGAKMPLSSTTAQPDVNTAIIAAAAISSASIESASAPDCSSPANFDSSTGSYDSGSCGGGFDGGVSGI